MSERRNGVGSMAAVAVVAAIALMASGGMLLAVYEGNDSDGYYEYSIDGTFGDGWILDGDVRFAVIGETDDGVNVRISMSLDVRSGEVAEAGFHFSGVETEFNDDLEIEWPVDRTETMNTKFGTVDMDIYKYSKGGMTAELYVSGGVVYKLTVDLVPEADDDPELDDWPVSIIIELVGSNRV